MPPGSVEDVDRYRKDGNRGHHHQRVGGAGAGGRFDAIIHTGTSTTTRRTDMSEPFMYGTRSSYAAGSFDLDDRLAYMDVVANTQMRAPGGAALRRVCHSCGFLGDGAPVFEIRDVAGESTDMLIQSQALGEHLARALGDDAVVLMRRHGSTVVGATIPQAVFRSVYAEEKNR